MNRNAALHNIRIICPTIATILINTYRKSVRLIIKCDNGNDEIQSIEGTTQGDNLAMSFYCLGTIPVLRHLFEIHRNVKQVWLADDCTGAGKLQELKSWLLDLIDFGIKYGYFVRQDKTWLI